MTYDIAIIGLGYVGLPLAQEATRAGMRVLGFDINAGVIEALSAGVSHVDDLRDEDIREMLAVDFEVTTDENRLAEADALVICVPTPLSPEGGPDLRAVEAAVATAARQVRAGALVVLESTTYPGTTQEIVVPAVEARDLKVGVDVFVAFSPERVDPGNPRFGIRNTPKVVGGITPACSTRAADMYSRFIDEIVVATGAREAETAKLLENTYRHVNIALVNEMTRFCHEMDIDIWEIIRLAKTKPFGFQAFYPGPGVGGHCIPIDPNYLSYSVRRELGYPFRFVELAQEINNTMPAYVARRAQDMLNTASLPVRGSRILLLGVTYKADIADERQSPAVDVAASLRNLGALLTYHDPHVPTWVAGTQRLESVPDLEHALGAADLVILLQAHAEYEPSALRQYAPRILDTRGILNGPNVERL